MTEKENRQPIKALRGDGGLITSSEATKRNPDFFKNQLEGAAWELTVWLPNGRIKRFPQGTDWLVQVIVMDGLKVL